MRPLVEPGPPLSPGDVVRFSRHALLPQVGDVGQRRLRNASVCVVGAGGLGSPALLYLAAAGLGRLGVVDRDHVDLTNLQRQVLHGVADVGRRKTASARDAITAIDPDVEVDVLDEDLTTRNAVDLLQGYDVVLDGTDNFPTRYVVNDACADLGVPLVWGSVLGFDAQVSVFWSRPADGGRGVDLRDLFPHPPRPEEVPSCDVAGVLGALCGQVGALMATEAVKLLTGVGEPLLGRVLVLDALAARWREVPLLRAAHRPSPEGRDRPDPARAVPVPPDLGAPVPPGGSVSVPPGRSVSVPPVRGALPEAGIIDGSELAERLRAGEHVVLVDVREHEEHASGAIPGSLHVPLGDLLNGAGIAGLPGCTLVLYCSTGVRSAQAARLVRAAGRDDVRHLAGGLAGWRSAARSAETAGQRARLAP